MAFPLVVRAIVAILIVKMCTTVQVRLQIAVPTDRGFIPALTQGEIGRTLPKCCFKMLYRVHERL
jgi:hypothetical protein